MSSKAPIQNALKQLMASLDRLEQAAGGQERKVASIRRQTQQDLFSGSNAYVVDPSLIARKLDGTIDKIEKLLREG